MRHLTARQGVARACGEATWPDSSYSSRLLPFRDVKRRRRRKLRRAFPSGPDVANHIAKPPGEFTAEAGDPEKPGDHEIILSWRVPRPGDANEARSPHRRRSAAPSRQTGRVLDSI